MTTIANGCDAGALPRPLTILRRARVPASEVRLSVVVPSYDTAAFVRQTLDALFAQTVRDIEVIAVDDGSRDASLAVLAEIEEPRLTVVAQPNRGLAGARNTGVLLARGAAVGFCDADDLWYPRKAERHLAVLAAEPDVGLTFSYSAYIDERGARTGQYLISRCARPSARDLIRRNHVGNGSTVVARRAVFTRAGLFDESIGSCEDFEMWVRAAACSGYGARLLPEVLTAYRVRSGSMSTTYDDFVRGYARALGRFRTYVPGFTAAEAARSYAEGLRIASRKAFSHGDVDTSRRLLAAALRAAPTLPVRDLRALGMVALHAGAWPLPPGGRTRLYRAVRGAMRVVFRAMPALAADSRSDIAR
ncbi:MAG: glycosyltransferase family 2 protein [Candidatus Binatia bacterium]